MIAVVVAYVVVVVGAVLLLADVLFKAINTATTAYATASSTAFPLLRGSSSVFLLLLTRR